MSSKQHTFKLTEKKFGNAKGFQEQEQIGEKLFNSRKNPKNKYIFEENGSPVRISKRDYDKDAYFERAPKKQRKFAENDVPFTHFALAAPALAENLSFSDIPPELRTTFQSPKSKKIENDNDEFEFRQISTKDRTGKKYGKEDQLFQASDLIFGDFDNSFDDEI